tara:strand:+ start:655 stop:1032 length:378 start_codon:yes stop_codon:yes gene_type:complete
VEVVEGPLTLVVVLNQVLRVDPVVMVEVVVDQMKDLEVDQVESDLVMDGLEELTPVEVQNQTVVDMVDLLPVVEAVVVEPQDQAPVNPLKLVQDIMIRRQHGALLEEMVVLESLSSDMSYLQTMI